VPIGPVPAAELPAAGRARYAYFRKVMRQAAHAARPAVSDHAIWAILRLVFVRTIRQGSLSIPITGCDCMRSYGAPDPPFGTSNHRIPMSFVPQQNWVICEHELPPRAAGLAVSWLVAAGGGAS
jgi:hypothetical protein